MKNSIVFYSFFLGWFITWMLLGLIGYAFFQYPTYKEAVTSDIIMLISLCIGWVVPMPLVNDLDQKFKKTVA